jgi:hypothetical protein
MTTKHRTLYTLVLVLAIAGGFAIRLRAADTLPQTLTDDAFWKMITDFSEDAGSFRFQFMSNEREFPSVIPALKKTAKPGGVYLGVGPEQNFTYIAATQPKLAIIFDIRRENMIEHLIYKSVFELSTDRNDFVSRLFSRKAPAGLNEKTPVTAMFRAYGPAMLDAQLLRQNLQAIHDNLLKTHRFAISAEDLANMDGIYRTICEAGPNSAYASLMTAADDQGQMHSYLASEENFRLIQQMHKKNVIVPLVGNFAGPKAIREVAKYLKDHGATVAMFYTSNVEQYLFQQGDDWRRYYANVATLPVDTSSTFLRSSHFAYDAAAPRSYMRQFPGSSYVMLLCSIADLVKAFNAGHIETYDQVIRMSSVKSFLP